MEGGEKGSEIIQKILLRLKVHLLWRYRRLSRNMTARWSSTSRKAGDKPPKHHTSMHQRHAPPIHGPMHGPAYPSGNTPF